MKALLRYSKLLVIPLLFSFVAGCINLDPVADGTNFYILSTSGNQSAAPGKRQILVRNLELADYLKNSQLAQRDGANRITYLANHRWAGPLDKMIADTIAEVITANSAESAAYTLATGKETHYLDARVLQFDFTPGKQTRLLVEYVLIDAETRGTVRRDYIKHQQNIPDASGMEEIVAALELTLRKALENLSI